MRPFVKGSSGAGRSPGYQFAIALVIAYVTAATLVVLALAGAEDLIRRWVPVSLRLWGLVVACGFGVLVDIAALRAHRLSLGPSRQTSKQLLYLGEHAWITPYFWGLDAGLIWSTYRVSFTSWILLIAAVSGAAPPFAGAMYGLAFSGPLLVMLFVSGDRLSRSRLLSMGAAQRVGIATMMVMMALAARLTGHVA